MMRDLADCAKAPEGAIAAKGQLTAARFGPNPAMFADVMQNGPDTGSLIGFATNFLNSSAGLGTLGSSLRIS